MPIVTRTAPETIRGLKPRTTYLPALKIKETWSARIKDAALFSARTTSTTYLKQLKEKLAQVADRGTNPIQAQDALQAALKTIGYTPQAGFAGDAHRYGSSLIPPATPGSITDLSSAGRIRLIIDTNVKQARSMAQKASSQDPVFLLTNPAWRLERTGARKEPRKDWAQRWNAAGNSVGWEGALKGDFVALKDSPIWQAIGDGTGGFEDTLGTDYPPFAFGSGLAWTNVGRKEWKDLCAREGVPDHLDELMEKALDMEEAREAAQEAPGALGEGADGQGEGWSAEAPVAAPAPVFHPDYSARDKAEDAIKAAGLRVQESKAKVQAAIAAIGDEMEDAVESARSNPDAVDAGAVEKEMDAIAADAEMEMTAVDGLAQILGKWSDQAQAIPAPTDAATQDAFDQQAGLIARAAEGVTGADQVARAEAKYAEAEAKAADVESRIDAWYRERSLELYGQGEAWNAEIDAHERVTEYSAEIADAKKQAKAKYKKGR